MRYLIIFTFLLISNPLGAQVSFSLEGGYQFKMGGSKLSDGKTQVDGTGTQGLAIVQYSFGEGMNFAGTAMVNLTDNWQVGLKVSYLLGNSFFGYTDTQFQSSMLRFVPQTKFVIAGDRLNVFTTVGLIVGKGGIVEDFEITEESTSTGTRITNRVFTYSEGLSYGINNVIGVEYQTDRNINFFFQLDSYIQSYGPKKREITTYTIDGADLLPSLNTSDIEIEYVDFLAFGQQPNPNVPDQKLRRIYPFSSMGVSVGAIYNL